MGRFLRATAAGLVIGMWMAASAAEEITAKEITGEQIRAIDQQVQEIKNDVLAISTGITRLEEKLIYPANTQLSIFLAVDQNEKFRLDAVNIRMDGKAATSHIYTSHELEALQHGGVQRIYIGNIRTGEHELEVALTGKSTSNDDYRQKADYKFTKDAGAKLIKISLAGPGSGNQAIVFRD